MQKIQEIDYYWDTESNSWTGIYQVAYTHDARGSLLEKATYFWNSAINGWECNTKDTYIYDVFGRRISRIGFNWDPEAGDWIYDSKILSFWSVRFPYFECDSADPFTVFPDPFTDYATVIWADSIPVRKIELVHISGEIAMSIDNISGTFLTIVRGSLAAGVYLIRVQSDKTCVKKVIIQ